VGKKPTDRGKIGTTRRVLTDGGGGPMGLAVEGAHRNACKMVEATRMRLPIERPTPTPAPPQGRCRDQGDDDAVRERLAACGLTAHLRARGEEAKALKQEAGFKARRWVVERTPRWMNRFRRVRIRWDKNVCHYLALLHLACAYITYRQAGLLG
jgi:putative transposase